MHKYESDPTSEKTKLDFLGVQKEAVERAKEAQFVKLGDMPVACVDGRTEHEVLGVPGGDAGLLVSALQTAEQMAGRELSKEEVAQAVEKFAKFLGRKIYLHSDNHAEKAEPGEEVTDKCIGCGHLKHMQKPEEKDAYGGARQALVRNMLSVLYEKAGVPEGGQPKQADCEVLQGGHGEQGVLIILPNEGEVYDENTMLPAVQPSKDGVQLFVFHAGVEQYYADKISKNLQDILPGGFKLDQSEFKEKFAALLERQRDATVATLAGDKPKITVRIKKVGDKAEVELVDASKR